MTDTMQPSPTIEPTKEVKGLQHSLNIIERTSDDIHNEMDEALGRQAMVEQAIGTLSVDPALADLDY